MNKFQRSWLLLRSSLSVIAQNKLLLIFPVVTFICTAVIILFFAAPGVLHPTGYSYMSTQHWEAIGNSLFQHSSTAHDKVVLTPLAMVYMAGLYFLAMFIATFFNVAFYHEILGALTGETVSIERGLKFAASKWRSILLWTVFAGLVGLLIKLIEERFALVGRITARLIGIAWSIAAVFVIPAIVRDQETSNPVALLRKSAGILKRTWGEALIGYAGLTAANLAVLAGSILWLFAAAGISAVLKNFWILTGAGVLWVCALVAWSYVAGVASHVYKGALYLYAAEGVVATPYNQEMLEMGWKFKKS